MSKKLYKYINPEYIDKIFPSTEHPMLKFKCSYPKNFNDPYELSLTIDYINNPKVLAFYSDVIGELPQLPTTCFSRSPSVIPMWAHYAQSLQGFAIELDEEKLASHFPKSAFGDVDYREEPDVSISNWLYRAYTTAKFRHTYILQKAVFSAAYFTKSTCWSYELERRMVINPDETRDNDGIILIDIPLGCVSAIICGPRAASDTKNNLHELAGSINCCYYEMKIGRSSSIPFFLDNASTPFIFENQTLFASPNYCIQCKEPLSAATEKCTWCKINESDRISASERNPYRILDQFGLLESYIEDMDKI